MKPIFLSVCLLFLYISCNGDEDQSPEMINPTVTTSNALIGDPVLVTFSGSYVPNGNEITEIGFEYALDTQFTIDKVTLFATEQNNNEIYYELNNGIEMNVIYYYRAFIKANDLRYYGLTKNFTYDGSIPPEITSISPEFGHLADTLEIKGNYFMDPPYDTTVEFDTFSSQIVSLSDTLIKCIVPTYMEQITNDVMVKIDNRADTYSAFSLYTPTIEDVNPIEAVIGDTIDISGTHFDLVNYRNKVHLGAIEATVIQSDRNLVQFVVPETMENPVESLTLQSQLQEVTYSQQFQLAPPEITGFAPTTATFGDLITIQGNNFDYELSRNKVFFGEIEATITYADRHTLIAIVPEDLASSSEPIKVAAQLQETTFEQNFQLLAPVINFIPENVYVNQDVTIEGANFHPDHTKNIVTFEDIPSNVDFGDTENLNTSIPLGPFPRRKAIARVQVLDLIVEYEIELNILDKWIMMDDDLPFKYNRSVNNAVVANNEAFVMAPFANTTSSPFHLWKFNPNDYSWEQNIIPFELERSTAVAESTGDKIYLYTANNNNAFYEYNPLSQQWTQLAPFPGERRDWATHFSVNGNIYIGMGADFDQGSITYGNFFKYSPATDSWVEIAEFTHNNYFLRTETSTFTLNGIAYIGNGATNTGMFDYWSYIPSTDEWIRIADFPDSRHYTASFVLNGNGYVTCGTPTGSSNQKDSWRYDPGTNTWTQSDDVGPTRRGGHFAFSLNGRAYVGAGGVTVSGGTQGYDFYEYIPD